MGQNMSAEEKARKQKQEEDDKQFRQQYFSGEVMVEVKSMEVDVECDSVVKISVVGQEQSTTKIQKSTKPMYKQTFSFQLCNVPRSESIQINVGVTTYKDEQSRGFYQTMKAQPIGLGEVLSRCGKEQQVDIYDKNKNKQAMLRLIVTKREQH